jgi:hypothetical protein
VADTPAEARAFVEEHGWAWPSILDRGRVRARKLGAEYQPHVIAVGADGRIAGSWEGLGSHEAWSALADSVS